MPKPISRFFEDLGFPLRNLRWSWGARSEDAILLRTWDDEYSVRSKSVLVLRESSRYTQSESYGLDERIVQLQALWGGGIAGYTVVANVKDRDAHPREIQSFREDAVFSLERLEAQRDGAIIAFIGSVVPVGAISEHRKTHRTAAASAPFPLDENARSGMSTSSYKQKLPAMRAWLIDISRSGGTVSYGEVMERFGLTFFPLRGAMTRLGHNCRDANEPVITALIVDKETRRCSQGVFDEFNIDDDEAERQRCYEHWSVSGSKG